MVLLESKPYENNLIFDDFTIKTADGNPVQLSTHSKANGSVIIFTCNHCPYALAIWERLVQLSPILDQLEVSCMAINPNFHPNYPEDSAENMIKLIEKLQVPFPYLCDTDQSIAKQFNAVCTPDLFYLNKDQELIYHGRLDDNWKNPDQVQSKDLLNAIQDYIKNGQITQTQHPAMGCSIKWL